MLKTTKFHAKKTLTSNFAHSFWFCEAYFLLHQILIPHSWYWKCLIFFHYKSHKTQVVKKIHAGEKWGKGENLKTQKQGPNHVTKIGNLGLQIYFMKIPT